MTGESLAGLMISLSRIITKSFIQNKQNNTTIFFSISIIILLICSYAFIKVGSLILFIQKNDSNAIKVETSEFVKFYRGLNYKQSISKEPHYQEIKEFDTEVMLEGETKFI